MPRQYFNNASSTLAANIGTGATTIEVQAGHGPRFGTPTVADPVRISLEQGSTREIVEATARTGDVLTVTRAVEVVRPDTVATAYPFTSGADVQVRNTAASYAGGGSPVFASGRLPHTWLAARYANGNNATGFQSVGPVAGGSGTETASALAGTSAFTARYRNGRVSTAAPGATARLTHANVYYNTATASRSEGFAMWSGFAISDAVFSADGLLFCGLHSFNGDLGALGGTDEFVGLYAAPSTANFAIVSNNGTAPITSVDLGANFPCNTTSTDWYEFALWKAAGVAVWNYELVNATSGQRASGTITADVPDFDGTMSCTLNRNSGAGSAAVGFDYNVLACTRLFGIA